ncbi:unnamed protein product [Polarella glacialis]|uniref:Uncharacterized protein n=1 Tax=Polarella glacialis TaxID=89957 RepID=A0A813GG88_POLGL|nr:unnamed protein product [Polarella glacialis]
MQSGTTKKSRSLEVLRPAALRLSRSGSSVRESSQPRLGPRLRPPGLAGSRERWRYGTPAWAQKSEAAIREEAEEALQEYLKDNPDIQGLVQKRATNKRRLAPADPEPPPAPKRRQMCIVQ